MEAGTMRHTKKLTAMINNLNTYKEGESEVFVALLIRDIDADHKEGMTYPLGGRWRYIDGEFFVIAGGNGPDCGLRLKIGADCVILRRVRKEAITCTYTLAEV
jgi:hypothetical protein